MNKTTHFQLGFILLLAAFIISVTFCVAVYYKIEMQKLQLIEKEPDKCASCMMYDTNVENGLNGVYFANKGYFCVWTEGRNFYSINKTIYHEACHALIHDDYKHFCLDTKSKLKEVKK